VWGGEVVTGTVTIQDLDGTIVDRRSGSSLLESAFRLEPDTLRLIAFATQE
jgi:hypothetical protein